MLVLQQAYEILRKWLKILSIFGEDIILDKRESNFVISLR